MKRDSGAVLSVVLLFSMAIFALVGAYVLQQQRHQDRQRLAVVLERRNALGNLLLSHVSDPEILASSVGGGLAGNVLLRNCLDGDSGTVCDDDGVFRALSLEPPADFAYRVGNCVSSGDVSCSLSGGGEGSGSRVAYDLGGLRGIVGDCFPWEAVTAVRANCGGEDSCFKPQEFIFRYQIGYFPGGDCSGKVLPRRNYGVYPKYNNTINVPIHMFTDLTCNVGAFMHGYDEFGNLDCRCRFPYRVDSSRQPDERGVFCTVNPASCVPGEVLVAMDVNGYPVCASATSAGEVVSESLVFSTNKNSTLYVFEPGKEFECPNSGIIDNFEVRCKSEAESLVEDESYSVCEITGLFNGELCLADFGDFPFFGVCDEGEMCESKYVYVQFGCGTLPILPSYEVSKKCYPPQVPDISCELIAQCRDYPR